MVQVHNLFEKSDVKNVRHPKTDVAVSEWMKAQVHGRKGGRKGVEVVWSCNGDGRCACREEKVW